MNSPVPISPSFSFSNSTCSIDAFPACPKSVSAIHQSLLCVYSVDFVKWNS